MNQKEKRQLETELLKMGLAGLEANGEPSGELVEQIAMMVNAWQGAPNRHGEWIDRHKFLRDLLGECDGPARQEMYEAIVPRLSFKAKPLHHYESMLAERVGNLVSKRAMRVEGEAPKPIEIGGQKVVITPAERANCGWAVLRCFGCDTVQKFLADTPVGAMIKARDAGWVRDLASTHEYCVNCAETLKMDQKRLAHA